MSDTIISTTTGDKMIPEVWAQEMIVARESYLVMAGLVSRFDDEVKNYGDVIHIPEVSDLSVNAVVEGTDVTYQANTESEVTITINKYYEASFLVHDKFSAQTKYRYAKKMASKAGYALAKQMDSDLLALYSDADNYVGDGSTAITKANILKANRILDGADVPSSERSFVVDEFGKEDLFGIDDFVRYDATGQISPAVSGAHQGGKFGSLYGISVYVSTNVSVETASPNVGHGILFHKEALGLAVQKNVQMETQRKAEKLADLYVTQLLYGVKTLRSDHMVDFRYNVTA